jgi:hypothetical protein
MMDINEIAAKTKSMSIQEPMESKPEGMKIKDIKSNEER